MKIQLLSDLHTEFWRGKLSERLQEYFRPADVLVLAGDISTGRSNVVEVLKIASRHFQEVIYIPGNHEYYGGLELNGFDDHVAFESKLPSNVHYLNNRTLHLDDVQFHGSTLWTDFDFDPIAESCYTQFINDYRRIPDATPHNLKRINRISYNFLVNSYASRDQAKKQVFVTHFMPALECVHDKWKKDNFTSALNKYFANNLGEWISTLDDATWLFGHTHDWVDKTIGQVRCLARPVGYPGEHNEQYKPLVLEL